MRVVKEDAGEYQAGRTYVDITPCIALKDTIEITDEEWDIIYLGFDEWETDNLYEDPEPTFAGYLRELMKLKESILR